MEENVAKKDRIDVKYSSDDSESEYCSSSCCTDSDGEKQPWEDNVRSDGSLFYIEYDADLNSCLEDSLNPSYPVESWSLRGQSKSKLNPAEKIKKWMQGRRKKARKSFPLKSSKSDTNLNVMSQDALHCFQSKDVLIDIDASKFLSSGKLCLSEKLFGLKLGSAEDHNGISAKPTVLSIISNEDIPDVKVGDLLKSVNDIEVNWSNMEDVLKGISMPSKVKLTFMSPMSQTIPKLHVIPPKHNNLLKELLHEPMAVQYAKSQYQHIPHGLFYLCIDNGVFENDEVMYKYPDENTSLFKLKGMFLTLGHMISDVASAPLLSCSVMIEGEIVHVGFVKDENNIMILALPASVASIAEVQNFSTALAKLLRYQFSSLQKTFMTGNEEGYLDNFLILYFKHYLSSSNYSKSIFSEPHLLDILPSVHWLPLPNDLKTEIDDILSELESSDFGSSSEGFYGDRRIYNIFGSCLFYKAIVYTVAYFDQDNSGNNTLSDHRCLALISQAQPVHECAKVRLGQSTFKEIKQFEDHLNGQTVVLFSDNLNRGYLLSSHLPKDDLLDIHLYLHYNHILELTHQQPVSQIIIWKEVFPSRHQLCTPSPDPDFVESHGRWFMLIVVMQHCILATLLDDSGCALKVEGYPPPEPFYVEEVQNTLFILQDCGITAATEKLLHFCVFPVVSPDLFYKDNSSRNSLSSVFASNVSIHSSGPNMSSDHSTSHSSLVAEKEGLVKMSRCSSSEKIDEVKRQQLLSSMGPADGESDTESSYSDGSNENMSSFEKRFRSCSVSTGSTTKSHGSSECSQSERDLKNQLSQRNFSSLPDLNGTAYTSDGICFENSFRMVSGFGNNLFYYLHMDPVEGIFIAPVVPHSSSPGSVQSSILDSFHRCCLHMRTVFERSLRNGEIIKANIKTKYGVNTFLQNAYEQGVQFQCNQVDSPKQKGSNHPVCFWVIGRLFFTPEPREVYVCHHDSAAQDIVEMAFRLGFGLSF